MKTTPLCTLLDIEYPINRKQWHGYQMRAGRRRFKRRGLGIIAGFE
jgi:hypothetical protein